MLVRTITCPETYRLDNGDGRPTFVKLWWHDRQRRWRIGIHAPDNVRIERLGGVDLPPKPQPAMELARTAWQEMTAQDTAGDSDGGSCD